MGSGCAWPRWTLMNNLGSANKEPSWTIWKWVPYLWTEVFLENNAISENTLAWQRGCSIAISTLVTTIFADSGPSELRIECVHFRVLPCRSSSLCNRFYIPGTRYIPNKIETMPWNAPMASREQESNAVQYCNSTKESSCYSIHVYVPYVCTYWILNSMRPYLLEYR